LPHDELDVYRGWAGLKRRGLSSSLGAEECLVYDVGRQRYKQTLDLQLRLHAQCKEGRIPGAVVVVEHEPVITLGARTRPENLLLSAVDLERRGIEVVRTDRGGDVTYHGPGQLVLYPIFHLHRLRSDVHGFLRLLEESVILTLRGYGLEAHRKSPAGVWVGERKICSIGIAVRRWVTYHGLALNVSPDMRHFTYINPCGLNAGQMVSMADLLSACPTVEHVKGELLSSIADVFGLKLINPPDVGA